MRWARFAAVAKDCTIRSISPRESAWGVCQPSSNGRASAEGATVGQAPSLGLSDRPPSHGRPAEAVRPAWASWMPMGVVV